MAIMSNNDLIIKVDEDFLSHKEVREYFELVSSSGFPWFLHNKTGVFYEGEIGGEKEDSLLVHFAYINGVPNSDYYLVFKELFDKFCNKNNVEYSAILRIRLNLFFSRDDQLPTGAHVDYESPHKVFLYYFNDSDGDTIFYDKLYEKNDGEQKKDFKKLFVSQPKAGKAIVFEGNRYHSPITPKKTRYRITLNIDFI